jgi:hypothetical protein
MVFVHPFILLVVVVVAVAWWRTPNPAFRFWNVHPPILSLGLRPLAFIGTVSGSIN